MAGLHKRLRREAERCRREIFANCLAALADEVKLLTELFQYRFQAGMAWIIGHSFGNLVPLTAMSEITGDLEQRSQPVLMFYSGEVLPATLSDVRLGPS